MGARVSRVFRNFNLESRVHRELSKEKPSPAPRHPARELPAADVPPSVTEKNEPLLEHLRSVFVESTEPPAAAQEQKPAALKEAGRRPLKYHFPGGVSGSVELTDVPRGKLTIVEALKALGSHQHRPQTWTPEKVAQEFCLDPNDTKALLEFFVPFKVEIIPPKTAAAKQLKAS
ncbi:NADH dehydrogenase [ubiquinone] 1 alpha subcomplex assembly factor 4 [Salarias fasciatus]|uniref:NADH dehydrogenase [ubiquinone] 1 alpha subcomplex assembly factor 4 n=1 Tax=Salarias fasciatus TaxID=181472 RepID=A0A672I1V8_SALFA|nr:NADH dehydrogenase [ubiquinone] 1 alpha subcomplex assembly factor 4 [Salarias fasciatus]